MTYLELARSALSHREQSEKRPSNTPSRPSEARLGCEISEGSEKSPLRRPLRQCEELAGREKSEQSEQRYALDAGWMTLDEAEQLKRQIIAAVTFEPERFSRERYEALLARWNAHEAAMTSQSDKEQVA